MTCETPESVGRQSGVGQGGQDLLFWFLGEGTREVRQTD